MVYPFFKDHYYYRALWMRSQVRTRPGATECPRGRTCLNELVWMDHQELIILINGLPSDHFWMHIFEGNVIRKIR